MVKLKYVWCLFTKEKYEDAKRRLLPPTGNAEKIYSRGEIDTATDFPAGTNSVNVTPHDLTKHERENLQAGLVFAIGICEEHRNNWRWSDEKEVVITKGIITIVGSVWARIPSLNPDDEPEIVKLDKKALKRLKKLIPKNQQKVVISLEDSTHAVDVKKGEFKLELKDQVMPVKVTNANMLADIDWNAEEGHRHLAGVEMPIELKPGETSSEIKVFKDKIIFPKASVVLAGRVNIGPGEAFPNADPDPAKKTDFVVAEFENAETARTKYSNSGTFRFSFADVDHELKLERIYVEHNPDWNAEIGSKPSRRLNGTKIPDKPIYPGTQIEGFILAKDRVRFDKTEIKVRFNNKVPGFHHVVLTLYKKEGTRNITLGHDKIVAYDDIDTNPIELSVPENLLKEASSLILQFKDEHDANISKALVAKTAITNDEGSVDLPPPVYMSRRSSTLVRFDGYLREHAENIIEIELQELDEPSITIIEPQNGETFESGEGLPIQIELHNIPIPFDNARDVEISILAASAEGSDKHNLLLFTVCQTSRSSFALHNIKCVNQRNEPLPKGEYILVASTRDPRNRTKMVHDQIMIRVSSERYRVFTQLITEDKLELGNSAFRFRINNSEVSNVLLTSHKFSQDMRTDALRGYHRISANDVVRPGDSIKLELIDTDELEIEKCEIEDNLVKNLVDNTLQFTVQDNMTDPVKIKVWIKKKTHSTKIRIYFDNEAEDFEWAALQFYSGPGPNDLLLNTPRKYKDDISDHARTNNPFTFSSDKNLCPDLHKAESIVFVFNDRFNHIESAYSTDGKDGNKQVLDVGDHPKGAKITLQGVSPNDETKIHVKLKKRKVVTKLKIRMDKKSLKPDDYKDEKLVIVDSSKKIIHSPIPIAKINNDGFVISLMRPSEKYWCFLQSGAKCDILLNDSPKMHESAIHNWDKSRGRRIVSFVLNEGENELNLGIRKKSIIILQAEKEGEIHDLYLRKSNVLLLKKGTMPVVQYPIYDLLKPEGVVFLPSDEVKDNSQLTLQVTLPEEIRIVKAKLLKDGKEAAKPRIETFQYGQKALFEFSQGASNKLIIKLKREKKKFDQNVGLVASIQWKDEPTRRYYSKDFESQTYKNRTRVVIKQNDDEKYSKPIRNYLEEQSKAGSHFVPVQGMKPDDKVEITVTSFPEDYDLVNPRLNSSKPLIPMKGKKNSRIYNFKLEESINTFDVFIDRTSEPEPEAEREQEEQDKTPTPPRVVEDLGTRKAREMADLLDKLAAFIERDKEWAQNPKYKPFSPATITSDLQEAIESITRLMTELTRLDDEIKQRFIDVVHDGHRKRYTLAANLDQHETQVLDDFRKEMEKLKVALDSLKSIENAFERYENRSAQFNRKFSGPNNLMKQAYTIIKERFALRSPFRQQLERMHLEAVDIYAREKNADFDKSFGEDFGRILNSLLYRRALLTLGQVRGKYLEFKLIEQNNAELFSLIRQYHRRKGSLNSEQQLEIADQLHVLLGEAPDTAGEFHMETDDAKRLILLLSDLLELCNYLLRINHDFAENAGSAIQIVKNMRRFIEESSQPKEQGAAQVRGSKAA